MASGQEEVWRVGALLAFLGTRVGGGGGVGVGAEGPTGGMLRGKDRYGWFQDGAESHLLVTVTSRNTGYGSLG